MLSVSEVDKYPILLAFFSFNLVFQAPSGGSGQHEGARAPPSLPKNGLLAEPAPSIHAQSFFCGRGFLSGSTPTISAVNMVNGGIWIVLTARIAVKEPLPKHPSVFVSTHQPVVDGIDNQARGREV